MARGLLSQLCPFCPKVNPNALDQLQKIDRSQNIDGWNVQLYFFSRNPGVLLAVAVFIVGICFGIATWVQKPVSKAVPVQILTTEDLKKELAQPKPDMAKVIAVLKDVAFDADEDVPVGEWITGAALTPSEKLVAKAAWSSLTEGDQFEPSADLLYYAHYVKPLRFANELIGDHYLETGEFHQAATYYRREARFPDAEAARTKLLEVTLAAQDREMLKSIGSDPTMAKDLKPEHRIYLAAAQQKWGDLLKPLGELQAHLLKPVPAFLAALAGLVWLAVALQSVQPPGLFSFRVALVLCAVVMGMCSTFPTLISGLWMEETLGLREGESLYQTLTYFLFSVGPREEILKLLFVVPLMPLCIVRKSRLEMLIAGGAVGLGFAIWENLQYFAQYGSAAAFTRFLTANFFHLALTGLNALALYDLICHPIRRFLPFVGIFVGTVVAHAMYDFLASVPGMVLLFGDTIIFMLVSLFFFRTLRVLRDGSTDQLSIGATFVVGVSTLTGAILILASREIGLHQTLLVLGVTSFFLFMVGYMFFWQLGSGMTVVEEVSPDSYRI